MSKRKPPPAERQLPDKQQVLDYIAEHPGRVTKRDIARHFGIVGDAKIELKALLKQLEKAGQLDRGHGKKLAPPGVLPEVALLDIAETDIDGELIAHPVEWREDGPAPKVMLLPSGRDLGQVGIGDRILARVRRIGDDRYEGRLVRVLQAAAEEVVGIFRIVGKEARIQPTDRRARDEYVVSEAQANGAVSGEFVVAEVLPGRSLGLKQARVKQRLGKFGDPRSLSLIAIASHDIPTRFPEGALAEAEMAEPVTLTGRDDLRDIPLVTIDPEDARDRDDAVWAESDKDPKNPGGWHLVVAIADVAHYVTAGSALDKEARKRGNSVYFPDRVVPMLPEKLSSGLCSLHDGENRACVAVHMWLDKDGRKLRHRFVRGLMRSVAALSYLQVQRAIDGAPDEATGPLVDRILRPLYGAYAALTTAREARQPLSIDLPERKVEIGTDGFIKAVHRRERFDAHKLIEEFMVLANVAAAETLEAVKQPCMYRVHDEPSMEKLESLREFLSTIGFKLARGNIVKPALFNRILKEVEGKPNEGLVNTVVLRCQMQAVYSGDNRGHFGLALRRYAHFTSPIRRYSDLLVHRALITGCKLGGDGLSEGDIAKFEDTAEHISRAERRAMAAERDALDRFTAAFMSNRVGASFLGRISGVTRFGLFIQLDETGADGLVPVAGIGDDYYDHDNSRHALVGRHNGRTFRLGDRVEVKLLEADVITGGLKLELLRDLDEQKSAPAKGRIKRRPQARPKLPRRRR